MHSSRQNGLRRSRTAGVVCAVLILGGCMMQDQAAPALSGPSGFTLLLTLAATPQVLPGDGRSQALVTLSAHDQIADTPISGQRFMLVVLPTSATLSTSEVTTASDGRAMFSVTAPLATGPQQTISISATAIAGISDRVVPSQLTIPLIFDNTGLNPTARFSVIPSQPSAGLAAQFDASASAAVTGSVITTYSWAWGDGTFDVTTTPTISKTYDEARTFAVTLTVTDNQGGTSTTAKMVTVVP